MTSLRSEYHVVLCNRFTVQKHFFLFLSLCPFPTFVFALPLALLVLPAIVS